MEVGEVLRYIDSVFPEHVRKTQEFLRVPSISSDHPRLIEAAQWLKSYVESFGGQATFVGKKESPILFVQFDFDQPKTLLVYGMYDVQPTVGQDWMSDPFAAEIRELPGLGPCIIARGACNSKGPLMGFLNALEAICHSGRAPVNLILTIEGEEEIGSPTLTDFFQQNVRLLKADAGFEPFWAEYGTDVSSPTLSLGTKGILTIDLICRGGGWGGPVSHPVHSSVGALLASPNWRLLKALSTLIDQDQEIAIAGFYDEVAPSSRDDETLLSKLSAAFDEGELLRLLGARQFKYPLHGIDLLRRYLFSPSIEARLIGSEDLDVLNPEARARVVIRLVPEMEPISTFEQVRRHLHAQGYGDIELVLKHGYPGARTSLEAKVVQAMLQTYRAFGREPQVYPLSASATPYCLFTRVLGIPYVWGGLGRAGGSHAPNEFASLDGLELFERSIVTFLTRFASA